MPSRVRRLAPILLVTCAALAFAQPRLAGPETPLALPASRYDAEGINEHPVAVGTASGFLVFWESRRVTEPAQLYVSRLDTAGARVEPTGVPLSLSPRSQLLPAAAGGLTSTLVVWHDGDVLTSDLSAVRVRDDGSVLDATPLALTNDGTSQTEAAVAFDGTEWLVVFTQRTGAGESNLRAVRVNEVSGAVSSAFDVVTAPLDQYGAALAWDGARWLIAYVDGAGNGDIYLQRMEPSGVPTEGRIALEVSSRASFTPTIAARAGRWTVGWQEPSTPTQVYVQRGSDAMAGSNTSFPSTNDQCGPHAYVNGTELEVVFHQAFAGFKRQLVPATGPFPVATLGSSPLNGNAHFTATASASGEVLAVIVVPPSAGDDSYLRGTRFGGNTQLLISEGSASMRDVSLLRDGPGAWALYGERVAQYDTWLQLGAQRVDALGDLSTDAGVLRPADLGVGVPSVASNGLVTLVAWPHWNGLFVAPWDRSFNATLDAGTTLTTHKVQSRKVGLAAVPDGGFLLAWADDRTAMFESDFYFTRLDARGAVLDVGGRPLRVGAGQTREVSLGFDGVYWVAATVDDVGGLEVARLDGSGSIVATRAVGVALDAPSLATSPGEALLVWSGPSDAGAQLFALRAFSDGGWSGDTGLAITTARANHRRPQVRWADTRYLVAFDVDDQGKQQLALGEFDTSLTVAPSARWSSTSDLFTTDLLVLESGDALAAATHFTLQGAALNSRRGFVARFTGLVAPPDAGTPDAGVPDAGTPDAGSSDAGTPDAGSDEPPDAGAPTGRRFAFVCGCSSVEGWALLTLLVLIRRRRH